MNKHITVLDFEVNRVFQYKVESSDFGPHLLEYYDDSEYERYLTNKGHNLTNCQWMVHEVDTIILDNEKGYDSRVYYNTGIIKNNDSDCDGGECSVCGTTAPRIFNTN